MTPAALASARRAVRVRRLLLVATRRAERRGSERSAPPCPPGEPSGAR